MLHQDCDWLLNRPQPTTVQAAKLQATNCKLPSLSCQIQTDNYCTSCQIQAFNYKQPTEDVKYKLPNTNWQLQAAKYCTSCQIQAAKIQLLNTSCQLQYISLLSGRSCAITPLNITHWLVTTTLLVITTISLLPVLTDYHLISSIYSYILSVLNEYHLITSI